MPSILLTGPAVEPVSLAEAKKFLRVEHTADDDLITALIAGSRIHVEAQTRRALITQSWRIVRDRWPANGRLEVLPVPLASVTAARIYRLDGTTQSIAPEAFTLDKAAAPAVLSCSALPAPGRAAGGIEIDITAGYGATSASVPEPLRQAIRQLVTHWYENRSAISVGLSAAVLPANALALMAPYRVVSL
jgi:uncharacterized phiE125 gp8 family phage protein